MLERFAYEAELEAQQEHLRSLNILASPLQNTRQVFDLMPRETEEDQAKIVERMGAVPEALERYRASLASGMEQGIVVAQRQVRGAVEQCRVWSGQPPSASGISPRGAGGERNPSFFRQLCDELGIDGGENVRAAERGYAAMGDWLEREYLPRANPRDPVGRERYQAASRGFNGIELDLDETYQWGWEEVWRIQSEMAATAERISPGASAAEAIAILESDDSRAIAGEDAFREWMQQTQDETMQALLGTHFDIAEPVQRIEAMIAPPGGALAMYYTGPSEDFSRPGRTWYPTGGETRFPLWRELSVCYHEGVPGHHLQIGTTRYLGEELTRYQRLLAGTSGYVEGWALYAERLMAELGYLEDPAYYMGLLSSQALQGGARGDRYRDAPGAADSGAGGVSRRRDVDAGAGVAVPDRALVLPGADAGQRGGSVPGLAGSGDQLQGRRARVAGGSRGGAGVDGRVVQSEGVPSGGAGAGSDGSAAVAGRDVSAAGVMDS